MSALSGHRRRTTSLWLQNARGEGIRFRIVSAPALGRILKDGAPTDNFTQLDLREAAVEYANNASGGGGGGDVATKDSMRVSVEAAGSRAEGEVVFHVFSESYWEPLVVVSNNSLLVEESTSIAITAYDLQVRWRGAQPNSASVRFSCLLSSLGIQLHIRQTRIVL